MGQWWQRRVALRDRFALDVSRRPYHTSIVRQQRNFLHDRVQLIYDRLGSVSVLGLDVGVDADNDRFAVDAGFGFLVVVVAAGDG